MGLIVSRETVFGQKTCSCCKWRPRAKNQRYCPECHAEYMREWRRKRTLSQDEWLMVQAARAEKTAR